MVRDYEDNKQRYAVCNSQWQRRKKELLAVKKGGGDKDGSEEARS